MIPYMRILCSRFKGEEQSGFLVSVMENKRDVAVRAGRPGEYQDEWLKLASPSGLGRAGQGDLQGRKLKEA